MKIEKIEWGFNCNRDINVLNDKLNEIIDVVNKER